MAAAASNHFVRWFLHWPHMLKPAFKARHATMSGADSETRFGLDLVWIPWTDRTYLHRVQCALYTILITEVGTGRRVVLQVSFAEGYLVARVWLSDYSGDGVCGDLPTHSDLLLGTS